MIIDYVAVPASVPTPVTMELVTDGRRYRTDASVRVAYHWCPGHATRYSCSARRIHLFRTPRGHYFCQEQETEPESSEIGSFGWTRLRIVDLAEALRLYLDSGHKLIAMEEAFPGLEIDA